MQRRLEAAAEQKVSSALKKAFLEEKMAGLQMEQVQVQMQVQVLSPKLAREEKEAAELKLKIGEVLGMFEDSVNRRHTLDKRRLKEVSQRWGVEADFMRAFSRSVVDNMSLVMASNYPFHEPASEFFFQGNRDDLHVAEEGVGGGGSIGGSGASGAAAHQRGEMGRGQMPPSASEQSAPNALAAANGLAEGAAASAESSRPSSGPGDRRSAGSAVPLGHFSHPSPSTGPGAAGAANEHIPSAEAVRQLNLQAQRQRMLILRHYRGVLQSQMKGM
jgi:hypothetical protein